MVSSSGSTEAEPVPVSSTLPGAGGDGAGGDAADADAVSDASRDDDGWLQRAQSGDAHAVDQLLAGCLPQLRAFVRLRMDGAFRARESSSDLVQSVCRELLADKGAFTWRGEAQFRGWLFTAALNKIREKQRYHRRERRDIARELTPVSAYDPMVLQTYAGLASPSAAAVANERAAAIEAAFDRLPEEYREVVTLARLAGLPHAEVAERMHRSVGAVRQLLGRALNKLAVEIGGIERRD